MKLLLPKPRQRARDEALAWLARLKRGLREREGPELLAWLQRRSHRACIAKAAVEWHGPEVLAVLSEIFPIDPDLVAPPRRRSPAIIAVAVLASACLTAAPFLLAHRYLPLILAQKPRAGSLIESLGDVYTASPGVGRRLALEDGTSIELNRGTRVAILYSEHMRFALVSSGEAAFTVVETPYRPFHVTAAGRTFEANGASFDVHVVDPSTMDLTVLEGTVTVFPPRPRAPDRAGETRGSDSLTLNPILLEPLQALAIAPDGESARTLTEQDVRTQLAWRASL